MRTSRLVRRFPGLPCWALVLLLGGSVFAAGAPLAAQAPLSRINRDTGIRSVDFEFIDHQTFTRERLRSRLALIAPSAMGRLKDRLAFLPLVSPGLYPFSPVELQKDLVRLRRFYTQSGFPRPEIDYQVKLDEGANRVEIVFQITEGTPIVRGTVTAVDESGADPSLPLPPELGMAWPNVLSTLSPGAGERIGDFERIQIQSAVAGWLRNRGYPFARVEASVRVDTLTSIGDVTLLVRTGSPARIGSIGVEGTTTLRDRVVLRELGVEPGDRFSAARLAEGERQLFGLDLIRVAMVEVPGGSVGDSTVDVRVRVEEGLPRVISGQLGYASEVGITGQADWTHRNFLGDARTFNVSAQGRTGQFGIGPNVQRRYSASVTLKQPYFYDRRVSLLFTPLAEYRDDLRDESVQLATDATLIYERGTFRSASLQFGVGRRRILQYRLGGTENLDFLSVLATVDSLNQDVRTSTVTASVTWGQVDDALAPRRGYFVRTSAEVTGPSSLSTVQYRRLEGSVTGFVPTSERTGIILRGGVGRLYPYGKSVPPPGTDPTAHLLRLRDVLFTGGGGYDVRGWGEQQLGPKFPDVQRVQSGTETVLRADRYVPLGGLARINASAELRLPFPGAGPKHSTHVFLDAGSVWSPDRRFDGGATPDARLFLSTGTGIELGTPVGAVRLTVGYKLNPSELDQRDPQDVLDALIRGDRVSSVPVRGLLRWHLHLLIGHAL